MLALSLVLATNIPIPLLTHMLKTCNTIVSCIYGPHFATLVLVESMGGEGRGGGICGT